VSHQPERKEKDCLNCGTIIAGRFCQNCGQENLKPKQKFGGLLKHFIYDVFHFDGKFFDTLRYLVFRPGFIPKQYIAGKRQSYLDPVRMYLFTSAVFFLLFFSLFKPKINTGEKTRLMTQRERFQYASALNQQRSLDTNGLVEKEMRYILDTSYNLVLSDSSKVSHDSSFRISLEGKDMVMVPEKKTSDSIVKISGEANSNWLERTINAKWIAYKRKYGDDTTEMKAEIVQSFLHKLPYLLFISLPFFALILKLLYVRRKNFYYSDHAVFTLYHYIFTFILLLFFFLLGKLYDWSGWGVVDIVRTILFLSGGVYLFIAMKRFYMQGKGKTFVKFLLLNFFALFVVIALFVVFIVFSIFQL
jgi:hypothetical protein